MQVSLVAAVLPISSRTMTAGLVRRQPEAVKAVVQLLNVCYVRLVELNKPSGRISSSAWLRYCRTCYTAYDYWSMSWPAGTLVTLLGA